MTKLAPVALAVSLVMGCGHGDPPPTLAQGSPTPFVFEPTPSYPPIDWVSSVSEARARAAEEHKPMIVFVRAAWAKAAVVMDTTIWNDARVLKEAPRFIALRVDVTDSYAKEKKMPPSLDEYVIESIPTTLVVTSDGRMVGRFGAGTARAGEVAKAMREAK